jgi:hypothetical protein
VTALIPLRAWMSVSEDIVGEQSAATGRVDASCAPRGAGYRGRRAADRRHRSRLIRRAEIAQSPPRCALSAQTGTLGGGDEMLVRFGEQERHGLEPQLSNVLTSGHQRS